MAKHLIPFKGYKYSGPENQNLLWQSNRVYLMDNHRAALWCWHQQLDLATERHRILYIDRHTDTLNANLEKHLQDMPVLRGISIGRYLDAKVQLGSTKHPLFRWDNYLSIHIDSVQGRLCQLISADHGDGDNPRYSDTDRPKPDQLSENVGY